MSKMFVLGDQSPWGGEGMLLLRALEVLYPGTPIWYFSHDADWLWRKGSQQKVEFKKGSLGSYASIEFRVLSPRDESVATVLGAPPERMVLVGPSSPPIIRAVGGEEWFLHLLSEEVKKILEWYNAVFGRRNDNIPLPNEFMEDPYPLLKWVRELAKLLGCSTIPLSLSEYLLEEFQGWWVVDHGKRLKVGPEIFPAPGRDALVRWFQQKGWILVGGNIPYLQPGKDYLQVHLEIVDEDRRSLEERLWEVYRMKKERAGKPVKPRPTQLLPTGPDVLSRLALGYRVRAWNGGRVVVF